MIYIAKIKYNILNMLSLIDDYFFSQDPFEDVPDIFKTEMSCTITTHFSAALKKINTELFLSEVIEVISSRLVQEDEQTGDMR